MSVKKPCRTSSRKTAGSSRRPSSPANANLKGGGVRAGRRGPRGVLGRAGASGWHWDHAVGPRCWTGPNAPFAKWFVGGKLNVAYNCLDRHVEAGRGDQVAFHWEGEPGDTRTITYADLQAEVASARQRAEGARRRRRATASRSTCR